ncbi:hypothetical protein ABS767_12730 [Sphingomonas sp. ST-64]|uniref:Lipoprotein n=1 Tax=Sphingomonas plantiphila TaxID=3163295 RepID=A0ABW8YQC3_9SPHN
MLAIAAAIGAAGCDSQPDWSAAGNAQPTAAASSRSIAPSSSSPVKAEESSGEKLLESLSGEMLLKSGYVIGTVELSGGEGQVFVQPPGAGNGDVMLKALATRVGRADIALSLVDPNDGTVMGALVLTEQTRGRPAGTLTFMGEKWDVEVPVIAELEGPIDYDLQAADIADDTRAAPGAGVTRPTYHLRGGKAGSNIRLHESVDASSRVTGTVNAGAQDIRVKRCAPEIDGAAFDRADAGARRALLDQVWCEAAVPMAGDAWIQGWLPGRLLEPDA